MTFRIEVLTREHNRTDFSCGVEALDRYFREQAGQDTRRRASACYVAIDNTTDATAGYFTLAASGVPLTALPDGLTKKLPRYPLVPVALLGRLAVDHRYRGQQLGAALLWDAAQRAARSEVMVYALVVDAKDDKAFNFYRHHGFAPFGAPKQLLLPMATFKL